MVFSDRISGVQPSAIREIFKVLGDPTIISFAGGNPDPSTFPADKMAVIAAELFEKQPSAALQYSVTEGYPALREKISNRLKTKFNIGTENDSLLVLTGGQQGIDLTCKVLCNEDDVVICEEPSFIGALNAFRSTGAKLVGVDVDDDGMNIEKLEAALNAFCVNVNHKKALDVGASTGGFTDCLLKRGAKEVYAIDAGIGQLHESLREDSRVHSIEHFNARELTPEITDGECDVAVADVSFISQTYIIAQISSCLRDGASFVSLIKPQFEAGRAALGKNGVVTNSAYRFLAAKRVINCALENGFDCVGFMRSPIEGGDGNVEYLAHFIKKSCLKPQIDDKFIKRVTLL